MGRDLKFSPFVSHAPGKVILSGEHSVVYGHPGLATTIDARTYAVFAPVDRPNPRNMVHFRTFFGSGQDTFHLALSEDTLRDCFERTNELACKELNFTSTELFTYLETYVITPTQEDNKPLTGHFLVLAKVFTTLFAQLVEVLVQKGLTEDSVDDLILLNRQPVKALTPLTIGLSRAAAIFFFYYSYFLKFPGPFMVSVRSRIPLGSGLGSSAALCVSLSGGIFYIKQLLATKFTSLSLDQAMAECKLEDPSSTSDITMSVGDIAHINSWARFGEMVIHGIFISGLDNIVATYGGFVQFENARASAFFPPGSFPQEIKMIVVNTGIEKDTGRAVRGVADLLTNHVPSLKNNILESMGALTHYFITLIRDYSDQKFKGIKPEDPVRRTAVSSLDTIWTRLQTLVKMNHALLDIIGVSLSEIEAMSAACRQLNLAFKITGAGCGGSCLIFVPPEYVPTEKATQALSTTASIKYKNDQPTQGLDFRAYLKQFPAFSAPSIELFEYSISAPGFQISANLTNFPEFL